MSAEEHSNGIITGPRMTLEVTKGATPRMFKVGQNTLLIGRDATALQKQVAGQAQLSIQCFYFAVAESKSVSACHCKIWYDPAVQKFFIQDLKSSNGTFMSNPQTGDKMFCIGDRQQVCEKQQIDSNTRIKAADVEFRVVAIEGIEEARPAEVEPIDAGATTNTQMESGERVLRVTNGPGQGQTFVFTESKKVLISRVLANLAGQAIDTAQFNVAFGTFTAREQLLIDDPDRRISRIHAWLRLKPETNMYELITQNAQASWVMHQPSVPTYSAKDVWTPVPADKTTGQPLPVELSQSDYFRLGHTVIQITNHAGPPAKMAIPKLRASSTTTLSLCWDDPASPTPIRAYVLVMKPENKNEWESIYGGGKLECTKDKLQPGMSYRFKIQARNGSPEMSPWSDEVTFTTPMPSQAAEGMSGAYLARLGLSNDYTGALHAANPAAVDQSGFEQAPTIRENIRWQKGRLLGQGAQGAVYVGRDLDTGTLMAVKELNIFSSHSQVKEERAAKVEEEINLMKKLSHQHIVRYYGSNRTVNEDYIVLHVFLEYVPGGSIATLMKAEMNGNGHQGGLLEIVAVRYTFQICKGLAYLHSQGTVHRDIKSDNILMAVFGDEQVCKIADFGASKKMDQLSTEFISFTGTPNFMAPEVVRQEEIDGSLSAKIDIWALGCTVIEMLAGLPPMHEYKDQGQVIMKIGTLKKPHQPPDVASELARDFIGQCLQLNPAKRPEALELLSHAWFTSNGLRYQPGTLGASAVSSGTHLPSAPAAGVPGGGAGAVPIPQTPGAGAVSATPLGTLGSAFPTVNGEYKQRSSLPVIQWSDLEIGEEIGSGGYGKVHLAKYEGTVVAVKTTLLSSGEANLDSLIQEATILSDIRHPNLVLYMALASGPEKYGIVTEYVDGGDLSQLIHGSPDGTITLEKKLQIMRDVANGLANTHKNRLVHRDIKPQNILLEKITLKAKIGDFGLAGSVGQVRGGTRRYASPEVLRGEPATPASDMYAFGLVLYELLTKTKPFAQFSDPTQRMNHPNESPAVLDAMVLPHSSLRELLTECWSLDPAARPHARDVSKKLDAFLLAPWVKANIRTIAETAATASPVGTRLQTPMMPHTLGVVPGPAGGFPGVTPLLRNPPVPRDADTTLPDLGEGAGAASNNGAAAANAAALEGTLPDLRGTIDMAHD